jgi:aminoglycoside phosphotransferase (APT) family kinase protein
MVALENDIHVVEVTLQTRGAAMNGDIDFGVIRRAELQLGTLTGELHEIRELLAFWEHRQGRQSVTWHMVLILVAVYGAIILMLSLYLTLGARG